MTPQLRAWAWSRALSGRLGVIIIGGGETFRVVRRPWPRWVEDEVGGAVSGIGIHLGPTQELIQVVTDADRDLDDIIREEAARTSREANTARFEAALAAYRKRTGDRFLSGNDHLLLLYEVGYLVHDDD